MPLKLIKVALLPFGISSSRPVSSLRYFLFFILVFLEGVANFPVCVRAVFVYCCIKKIVCVCVFLDDLYTCEFVTCVHAYMYVYSNSVLIGLEMCICT